MEISSLTPFVFSFFVFLIFLQQLNYLKKKRFVPGPNLIVPFLGGAMELVRNPTRFWDNQATAAKSSELGFSANYIFGRFILFISKTDLSHKIFTNVRPDAFHLIGHPFGKKLFGEHNLIYMFGEHHKDLRRWIAPNFTPKALSTYSSLQQKIILKHLKHWVNLSKSGSAPVSLHLLCRDMNLETSQTVFAGPYLDSKTRNAFNDDYNLFNVGLMKLPVDLPGFAFRKARLAIDRLVKTLAKCATESKSKMKSGAEPSCLVDFWMQETLKEIEAAKIEGNQVLPPHCSDEEIGGHIFNFLFAAQDASTSSHVWAVSLLESHPEVLKKVREEVASIWNWESDTLITAEQLKEMKYTVSVVREIIRFRPPATMVPHIAGEEFPLTESYTIPKGTIVFPSLLESSFQGFTESTRFDPDRFSETRQEDRLYKKNFLSFGSGPHQCAGQSYALHHLTVFVALFTSLVNFKREKCDGRDDILYVPTTCPKDECKVYLSQRCTRYPSF